MLKQIRTENVLPFGYGERKFHYYGEESAEVKKMFENESGYKVWGQFLFAFGDGKPMKVGCWMILTFGTGADKSYAALCEDPSLSFITYGKK